MEKTHWKNLANYDYLGAYSFGGMDLDEIVLTIKSIKKQVVTASGGKKEECIVATFEESNYEGVEVKPMVFNKTNCQRIERLYSPFIEDWIGKKIIIYIEPNVKFGRDLVPALRVREKLPPVYKCSVCGKEITKAYYKASVEKYGVALCSGECLKKYQEQNKKEEVKEEGDK